MTKEKDALKEYIALHEKVTKRREELIEELRQINEVLKIPTFNGGNGNGSGRAHNEKSLKETVLEVLDGKELSKEEILEAVTKKGYNFSSGNPLNSLGVVIYSKKNGIKNSKGRFSIAK